MTRMTRHPTLHLSKDLSLPVEAVTQTVAILAKRGAGKTYTAAVIVEALLKSGLHVVVVDPVGVWWGLRSSADGQREGLPIVIMGGEHGDLPLDVGTGQLIADVVVEEGLSVVLDLSQFRKGEQTRFMTEFAERLYHKNRQPLHLVLDEADAFAPQRPMKGHERLLGAIEDLVRRGRARGIGVTLVTQRYIDCTDYPTMWPITRAGRAETSWALSVLGLIPLAFAACSGRLCTYPDGDSAAASSSIDGLSVRGSREAR